MTDVDLSRIDTIQIVDIHADTKELTATAELYSSLDEGKQKHLSYASITTGHGWSQETMELLRKLTESMELDLVVIIENGPAQTIKDLTMRKGKQNGEGKTE